MSRSLSLLSTLASIVNSSERISLKMLREGMRGPGGGGSVGPLPSTFDTIHPIDLIFGTCNELSLYFQLIETTWCLFVSIANTAVTKMQSQAAAIFDFQIFRFFHIRNEKW